jgi:hypothetical protein
VSGCHLAQVNVGRLRAPVDDPLIDDFRNALDQINALADAQPGFVWRLKGVGDNATDLRPDASDDLQAVNASVWQSPNHLAAFAYRTEHRNYVRRRLEWFEDATQPILALWWVPAGHTPSLAECLERLAHLRAHGPTPHAFTFQQRFEAPTAEEAAA